MDYEEQLRKMFLRYPHKADEVKVYIEPSLSGCDKDWLNNTDTFYKEVDTPEEADYIPVWLDYKHRCSQEVLDFIEKYPNKCLSSINLIESVNVEMPEITDTILKDIQEMLSSPDWESLYLGLSMLRSYYMNDECKNVAKAVIDTVQANCMNNTGTIIPFCKEQKDAITIGNLDIIKFYKIWLHNEFLKI